MTPRRSAKHVSRALRAIPVDAIAARVMAEETGGLWCIVAGRLDFVSADGGIGETNWDDPLEHAQFVRFVQADQERVHLSWEVALAFVRSRLGV